MKKKLIELYDKCDRLEHLLVNSGKDLAEANKRIEELEEILERKNAIIFLLAQGDTPTPQ